MDETRYLRISQLPENFPVKKSTLYKWKHLKIFPGLFIKFGGILLIDLRVLQEILEQGRDREEGGKKGRGGRISPCFS